MQQRTGFRPGKPRLACRDERACPSFITHSTFFTSTTSICGAFRSSGASSCCRIESSPGDIVRFSDHYPEKGWRCLTRRGRRVWKGSSPKSGPAFYDETRSRDWLKIKITRRQECVIGGYTDPEGSRSYFGALVLGLYNKKGQLIHVGQVGTGFDQRGLKEMFARLQPLVTGENPFDGEIGGLRRVHFVRPELVAEIKFSEWTHETEEGGPKLRAPVFLGLREDKAPQECTLEDAGVK